MHVDLTGYIEETYRIGRNELKNRPLVIELISKRMVKHIKENRNYFQGTGLYLTDFLDKKAQKERFLLREEMIKARKKGLHAVIRNNQLLVEGKRMSITTGKEPIRPQEEKDNHTTPTCNNAKNRRHEDLEKCELFREQTL